MRNQGKYVDSKYDIDINIHLLLFLFIVIVIFCLYGVQKTHAASDILNQGIGSSQYKECASYSSSLKCKKNLQCVWRGYLPKCTNKHYYYLSNYIDKKETILSYPTYTTLQSCKKQLTPGRCSTEPSCTWRAYITKCTNTHKYHLSDYIKRAGAIKRLATLKDPSYDTFQFCKKISNSDLCKTSSNCAWRAYISRCTNTHKYHLSGYIDLQTTKRQKIRITLNDPGHAEFLACRNILSSTICKKELSCTWRAYIAKCTNIHKYHLYNYIIPKPNQFNIKSAIYISYEKCRKNKSYQVCNREYKFNLTKHIQIELKRVGCNPGPIDGIWGPLSRSALLRFNKLTSAALLLNTQTEETLKVIKQSQFKSCR